jgi:hypothetical protein
MQQKTKDDKVESPQCTKIEIGDQYEIEGRLTTSWLIDAITNVPGHGTMVRLSQIDGLCRVTVPASELSLTKGFWRTK